AIERLDLDSRAEHRLCDIDGDGAVDVESLAPEKPVRLDTEHDDDITAALGTLPLQSHSRPFIGPRRHGDHQPPVNSHLSGALTRRAPLRRHLSLPAADRAGTIHRESAL